MKKAICIALVAVMALTFFACADNEKANGDDRVYAEASDTTEELSEEAAAFSVIGHTEEYVLSLSSDKNVKTGVIISKDNLTVINGEQGDKLFFRTLEKELSFLLENYDVISFKGFKGETDSTDHESVPLYQSVYPYYERLNGYNLVLWGAEMYFVDEEQLDFKEDGTIHFYNYMYRSSDDLIKKLKYNNNVGTLLFMLLDSCLADGKISMVNTAHYNFYHYFFSIKADKLIVALADGFPSVYMEGGYTFYSFEKLLGEGYLSVAYGEYWNDFLGYDRNGPSSVYPNCVSEERYLPFELGASPDINDINAYLQRVEEECEYYESVRVAFSFNHTNDPDRLEHYENTLSLAEQLSEYCVYDTSGSSVSRQGNIVTFKTSDDNMVRVLAFFLLVAQHEDGRFTKEEDPVSSSATLRYSFVCGEIEAALSFVGSESVLDIKPYTP